MYHCANCDTQYAKWQGRCNECGHWGSLKLEESAETGAISASAKAHQAIPVGKVTVTSLTELSNTPSERIQSSIAEFNNLVGGGVVPASLVLLAGEPGIGKSTLILQLAQSFQNANPQATALYLAGEESPEQIKSRVDRLGIKPVLKLLRQPSLEQGIIAIEQEKPAIVIVDSIQTLASSQVDSSAGSVNQVRACASMLLEVCKKSGTTCFIIGQVTKDGTLAGPKTLEHLVDTVMYIEGEAAHDYRILRVTKNRFGPTDDIMVMSMTTDGLKIIDNPALIFLGSQTPTGQEGSVITPIIDGTKTFLVEIQALVTPTNFGYPQRRSSGFDNNRLQLLLAVLVKRGRLTQLNNHDVHINVVGGYKITEPAADLAVCLAVASSLQGRDTGSQAIFAYGEVGLGGEVRPVKKAETRNKEINKLGTGKLISPANTKNIIEALNLL